MKRRFVASAPLLLMGLLSATSAQAQSPALDQTNEPYNLYSVQLYTGAVPGGQTFTAGMDGELSRASVYVQKWCLPNCPDMLLQLRSLSGQVLASGTVNQAQIPQGSYNWIDVTFSTPALVAAGTQYALVMQNAQPNLSGGYDWRYELDSSVDSYPAGMMFQVGYNSHPDSDLYFRTYVSLPDLPANLALGKPTSQSSTAVDGVASRAVDGNTDGSWGNGSVTHTDTQSQPWWQVDLQNSQVISTVVLYNRTDCCSDRL